jgi:hypothetical protein
MKAGKSRIQDGDLGRIDVCWWNSFFLGVGPSFYIKALNALDEAHLHYGGLSALFIVC